MRYPVKLAITLLVQLAMIHATVFAGAPIVEPFDPPVEGQNPAWSVESGAAELVSGQAGAVGTALQLNQAAVPNDETCVTRPLPWDANESIAFIDFLIQPAANPEGSLASVYANGTQVAFQTPTGSANGQLWVLHGNDDLPEGQQGSWLKTPAEYAISPTTQQATAFQRITFRHDYERNIWDLFIDGKMAAANLAFENRETALNAISFYGSATAATLVDELKADATNMLFPDDDKDGLPNDYESAIGSNPNVYDRDAINPATGQSFLEGYLASLWNASAPNGGAASGAVSSASIPPLTILAAHQPVGALKGSMNVGGDGAATYSIPIDIPKGTGGMEPKITLNYSSNAGNGMCGVGWSLGGLQKITRGPSSAAKDGQFDPVDFDEHDRFFLDGERLICVGGTYGSAGSEYRTEIDAFSRITLRAGGIGESSLWWQLETKAGLLVELGRTLDSRETCDQGVLSWDVSKVSDTLGNYYAVEYAHDSDGDFANINRRVAKVSYTGKENGHAPYCSIEFIYEDRADQSKAYTRYSSYLVTQRLAKVMVRTGSYVNHSYRLTYQNSYQTNRSFLTSIQKFAQDQLAIPATTFQYDGLQQGQPMWVQRPGTDFKGYNMNVVSTSGGVISHDGISSVGILGNCYRSLPLNPVQTIFSDSVLSFEYRSNDPKAVGLIFLDNNNSYSNIINAILPAISDKVIQVVGAEAEVLKAAGFPNVVLPGLITSYAPAVEGGWVSYEIPIGSLFAGDKGYLVLGCVDDKNSTLPMAESAFRNIRIFQPGSPSGTRQLSFAQDWDMPKLMSGSVNQGVQFMDLNSDGLPDMSTWRATSYTRNATTGAVTPVVSGRVYRNTGSSFVVDQSLCPPASTPLGAVANSDAAQKDNRHQFLARPIDINSDGKLDLIESENIHFNNNSLINGIAFRSWDGTAWSQLANYTMPFLIKSQGVTEDHYGRSRTQHFEWADIDADGYTDLLVFMEEGNSTLVDRNNPTDVLVGSPALDPEPDPAKKSVVSSVWLNKVHLGQGWVRNDALGTPVKLRDSWPKQEDYGRRLLDANGDGRLELVRSQQDIRHTHFLNTSGDGSLLGWNASPAQEPPASPWDLPKNITGAFVENARFVNTAGNNLYVLPLDLNGDGLIDLQRSVDFIGKVSSMSWINHGENFGRWVKESTPSAQQPQRSTYILPRPISLQDGSLPKAFGYEVSDLNGDGLADILFSNWELSSTPGVDNLAIVNTGTGWEERPEWGMPDGLRIYASKSDMENGRRGCLHMDINGDSFPDLITNIDQDPPKIWINQCKREVLTSVTDGFGSQLQVEYRRMNDATPVAGTNTPTYERSLAPLPEGHACVIDSRLLVARLKQSDGRGGWIGTRRHYDNLRFDRLSESSLGFQHIEVHTEHWLPDGTLLDKGFTTTECSGEWPYAGSPVLTKSYVNIHETSPAMPGVAVGTHLVGEEITTYGQLPATPGVGGSVWRPVQLASVAKKWELNGTLSSQVTTSQALADYDEYGFVRKSTVTASDGGAQVTESAYTHNTTGKWHLGRMTSSTVTKTAPGKTAVTKSSSFAYHGGTGLLISETVQPGHANSVITAYTHDAFGNVTSTAVTANGQTRTKSSAFDSSGRFPVSESNALGHTVSSTIDWNRALVTSTTDIDGLTSYFEYDAFGTKLVTRNPDGTASAEITRFASNNSLPSAVASALGAGVTVKWARSAQASGTPWSTVYFDNLGREVAKETTILTSYSGSASSWRDVYTVTRYDDKGRQYMTSQPFFPGGAIHWTTANYGPADRLISTVHPDGTKDEILLDTTDTLDGQPVVKTTSKSSLAVSGGDAQTLTRWVDANGRLLKSQDVSGQETVFHYDVEGRVLSVAVAGTTVLTNSYDIFGNKTGVADIDAGASSVVYNGFGEAISSTNARGETTTTTYDALGRVATVTRPNGEGAFTHTYRTSSPAKGKPATVSGPNGWSESVSYDGFGRPLATTTTRFGESFTSSTTYDALGRVSSVTDAGGLTTYTDYDPVFSAKVRVRASKPSGGTFTLWEARAYDVMGRATSQVTAQGVQVDSGYEPTSAKLTGIQSTRAGQALQNLAYTWDSKMNLLSRADHIAGKSESFTYDGCYRLATSTVAGGATQTYAYDARGNLLEKGNSNESRSYGAGGRIHAVSSATIKGQQRSFSYDAAGHVTNDGLRTYAWTSFGQLASVSQVSTPLLKSFDPANIYGSGLPGIPAAVQYQASLATAQFDFDPSGSRARQTLLRQFVDGSSADVTTLYLGSYEREIHRTTPQGGGAAVNKIIHRHSLGSAVYTIEDKAGAPGPVAKLTTLLGDHNGSTDVLLIGTWDGSDFVDQKVERQSFDAWGERRNAETWGALRNDHTDPRSTSGADYHRGYTGHEMLDDFGLIHMNGRIYDAELGRFLSPDPINQAPEFSQNFNSYSYVLNNPLSLTDPSGHSWLSKTWKKFTKWLAKNQIVAIVVSVVICVVAFYAAGAILGGWGGAVAQAGLTGVIAGGANAAVSGGSWGDVLRGAAIGGISGVASAGLLHPMAPSEFGMSWETAQHVVGHGIVGGATNAALGGKFQDGFISAAVSAAAFDLGLGKVMGQGAPNVEGGAINIGKIGRTVVAGIIGGTASSLGGGKFANGAYTAAFQHLLNAERGPKRGSVNANEDGGPDPAIESAFDYGLSKKYITISESGDISVTRNFAYIGWRQESEFKINAYSTRGVLTWFQNDGYSTYSIISGGNATNKALENSNTRIPSGVWQPIRHTESLPPYKTTDPSQAFWNHGISFKFAIPTPETGRGAILYHPTPYCTSGCVGFSGPASELIGFRDRMMGLNGNYPRLIVE